MTSIAHENDRDRYSQEFWDKIEKNNPELLDFILGFTANIEDENDKTMFLDGLWIMYSLFEREDELKELESLNV